MKEIKLSRSKYGQFFVQVDDDDFEWLNHWKWYPRKKGDNIYAVRGLHLGKIKGRFKSTNIRMHRLIMDVWDSKILVDHRDHNGLNNQRNNLRLSNTSQNCSNQRPAKNKTSKYLGVSLHKQSRRWVATAGLNNRSIYIGVFESEEEAALAYNKKAIELHGEFANLNQI